MKPWLGRFKLNIDGNVKGGKVMGGRGFRDHEGNIVFAFYKEFGEGDVLFVEAHASLFGIQLCQHRMLQNVDVEVD